MAKSELGTKRVCPVTGRKFYDLNKDPVISPYTGEVVPIAPLTARGRSDAAARAAAAKDDEVEETQDAELVSLEDADAEASGKGTSKKLVSDDDIDDIDSDDDDDSEDDTTLIEDTEEGDDDVTDIIGDGREDEEET